VSYKQGELESKLLISVAKDPAEAKTKLESLAKYFREAASARLPRIWAMAQSRPATLSRDAWIAVAQGVT